MRIRRTPNAGSRTTAANEALFPAAESSSVARVVGISHIRSSKDIGRGVILFSCESNSLEKIINAALIPKWIVTNLK